jgi:hypothetical protein
MVQFSTSLSRFCYIHLWLPLDFSLKSRAYVLRLTILCILFPKEQQIVSLSNTSVFYCDSDKIRLIKSIILLPTALNIL